MNPFILRLATLGDLPAINDIYNYYVDRSTCTYQTEHETLEGRQAWFAEHPPDNYPVIVAELAEPSGPLAPREETAVQNAVLPRAEVPLAERADYSVVGWGSLSKFRPRAAYAPTVEASIYIHHEFHRRGLGRLLLLDLIQRARSAGYHSLIGGASADQTASLALQESLGFQRVAHLKEVGYKFGRWLDVIYFQLMLSDG